MKVKMSAFFGISTLLFLFASCSSLPLPGTPTESLFILCGELERDLGTNVEGHGNTTENIRVSVVNLETGKEKDMVFYPSKSFISTTLEPGRYAMKNTVGVTVREKRGNWTDTRTEYIQPTPFLIEESTVFISPTILRMNARNGWYSFSSYTSMSSSNALKKNSMEDLFDERRFKAWELYQIVGWEIKEE
ncbi:MULTISPECIES: hypothetical protein [unclassified Oceanispirochaeta]|uniref:hypothetical protein n=1 Tax=unclassified Oceanispirochaeta TaxID=2635722 RepID=UPI000E09343F|nr:MULTISPECIES: hypothetical protein [unclassified Oceanispirochaeta]MBF9018448.1 hypothetical protein [Oceanispirochaeta sp. M2]NPD73900.1 hypothetical protein [Oceanispirochaeta sp. M1]RDG30359.1 hypothetical protein DV872_17530 [Oceanispirochaeta sp. M1]